MPKIWRRDKLLTDSRGWQKDRNNRDRAMDRDRVQNTKIVISRRWEVVSTIRIYPERGITDRNKPCKYERDRYRGDGENGVGVL